MRGEILSAIRDELSRSSRYIDFTVDQRWRDGNLWSIFVDLSVDNAKGLDESYEGSVAWWLAEPRNGAADVLSVIPENQQINLRFATTNPPDNGGVLRLYPPRYLEALLEVWTSNANAEQSSVWLEGIRSQNVYDHGSVPPLGSFSSVVRKNQAQAFDLMGWKAGFLWGPPGTGKTFTLGAMLAQHLVTFPTAKILLLSTTNTATDQALVAVDKALERVGRSNAMAGEMRRLCKRVGQHFVASFYGGREHLLPVVDENLIRQLAQLEADRPDKSQLQAYANWKASEESLRAEVRRQAGQVLDKATLAAMTTTRAAFTFDQLLSRAPFDLIVFDEASQVSLAHALALSPLGNQVVFAGDPQQLAPIVQSNQPTTERWLGRSMFAEMNKHASSTCFLDEQSRMAEPICNVVSNCFYDGKLVVADDAQSDPEWRSERRLAHVPDLSDDAVFLDTIAAEGTWSQKYRGPIRYKSAERVRDLVHYLAAHVEESEILILTPFRAQRTLIRTFVERARYKRVKVSTVHRAQGSERHTVIFDPTQGNNKFLHTEDARRLVNVALSRAKARLIVLISAGDRENPLFEQIATKLEKKDVADGAGLPVSLLDRIGDFPKNAIGMTIQLNGMTGQVIEVVQSGRKFRFRDFNSGLVRTFQTEAVLAKVRAIR